MREIILASSSPRRRELLSKYNLRFEVLTSDIDEKIYKDDEPVQIAMSLALEKVLEISKKIEKGIIIGADTIVVLDNKILGKPKDKLDAYNTLKGLSGKKHKVITGLSIIDVENNIKVVDYEESLVHFYNLTDETIYKYIETEEPFGKAGSYGIQGYGGLLVKSIEGSYDNIVGLPTAKLNKILNKYFNYTLL